jgi:peroxiredoxin (alkyl hydroperoxide reductase subunit C)
VEVFSMSVDSVFVHKMWNDHELSKMVTGGVPFAMLSDGGGRVGSVYGVYDTDAGVEMRGRFIIDPDGVIQGYEVLTPPVGRNVSETLRQIQAFQLVRNSKGTEATPSGWRPGKITLKPGPDLVGKVWEVWKTSMAFD